MRSLSLLAVLLCVVGSTTAIYMQDTEAYDASLADWRGVISAYGGACGGADGSLPLSLVEQLRPENAQFAFATTAAIALTAIASWYGASVADVTAVCGAVATQALGGPAIIRPSHDSPFLVGRKDSNQPNPEDQLPSPLANLTVLQSFADSKELTMDEIVVLLGTHSLLQTQGCRTIGYGSSHWCNPEEEDCSNKVLMFRWTNRYYIDACTPTIKLGEVPAPPPTPNMRWTTIPTREPYTPRPGPEAQDMCRFTNPEFIKAVRANFTGNISGSIPTGVSWTDEQCLFRALPQVRHNCPHEEEWFYTRMDAELGTACQVRKPGNELENLVRSAMRRYTDIKAFNRDYIAAYIKMVNTGATFLRDPTIIDGSECPSGYRTTNSDQITDDVCRISQGAASKYCMCGTEMRNGFALRVPRDKPFPDMTPALIEQLTNEAKARLLVRRQSHDG